MGWGFGRFTGACSLVGVGARFWYPLEFDWLVVVGGPPVVSWSSWGGVSTPGRVGTGCCGLDVGGGEQVTGAGCWGWCCRGSGIFLGLVERLVTAGGVVLDCWLGGVFRLSLCRGSDTKWSSMVGCAALVLSTSSLAAASFFACFLLAEVASIKVGCSSWMRAWSACWLR